MELKKTVSDIYGSLKGVVKVEKEKVSILDAARLREAIDWLVYNAVFNDNRDVKANCRWLIKASASSLGTGPASIQGLYEAMGEGKSADLTCRL
jgi:hypothetical protein